MVLCDITTRILSNLTTNKECWCGLIRTKDTASGCGACYCWADGTHRPLIADGSVALHRCKALAFALVTAGAFIATAGVIAFRQAKTTANPMNPDASSSLVINGIYRLTRNPMYLGFFTGIGRLGRVAREFASVILVNHLYFIHQAVSNYSRRAHS